MTTARVALLLAAATAAGCAAAPSEPPAAAAPGPAAPAAAPPAPKPAAAAPARPPAPIETDLSKARMITENADLAGYDAGESRLFFYVNATAEIAVRPPAEGEYVIVVKASCDAALNLNARMKVSVDGIPVADELTLATTDPFDYSFNARLKGGDRKISVEFTNDTYKENEYDRNLYVHAVTVRPK
jgi:hypothetical protein